MPAGVRVSERDGGCASIINRRRRNVWPSAVGLRRAKNPNQRIGDTASVSLMIPHLLDGCLPGDGHKFRVRISLF